MAKVDLRAKRSGRTVIPAPEGLERRILASVPHEGGTLVELSCRHTMWCPLPLEIVRPILETGRMICATCLGAYVEKAHNVAIRN
jgi:hypothetical protein